MVVEERIYTLHHGKVPEYLTLYSQEGRDIQLRILGCNVGYYNVDIGPQNTIVHLWAYSSLTERERRRSELTQNPEWQAYLLKIRHLILRQEARILRPAGFFADWVSIQLEQSHVV